jgi:hypothetical protein
MVLMPQWLSNYLLSAYHNTTHFFLDYEYEGTVNVWIRIIKEDENQIHIPHYDIFMEFLIISLVF